MVTRNADIRKAKGNVPAWLIGEKLGGVHENTVYRWLRSKLTPEKRAELLKAIEEAKKEFNESNCG